MTYDEYLASPFWIARKAAVIRARGYACERCRSERPLELHHRTYERLYRERPEDVELLCSDCHSREHGLTPKPPGRDIERLDSILIRMPLEPGLEVKDGITVEQPAA